SPRPPREGRPAARRRRTLRGSAPRRSRRCGLEPRWPPVELRAVGPTTVSVRRTAERSRAFRRRWLRGAFRPATGPRLRLPLPWEHRRSPDAARSSSPLSCPPATAPSPVLPSRPFGPPQLSVALNLRSASRWPAAAPHAEPDGDRPLDWHRIEPGMVDPVKLAAEVHDLLGPQRAQDGDLLGAAAAAVVKGLVQGLELDGVPAHADSEAQPAAAQ